MERVSISRRTALYLFNAIAALCSPDQGTYAIGNTDLEMAAF